VSARDGGPAFPQAEVPKLGYEAPGEGMSLRDYFAAKAMAALIHSYDTQARIRGDRAVAIAGRISIADEAYAQADAMLAAREAAQ
jgi:hypothetical protein